MTHMFSKAVSVLLTLSMLLSCSPLSALAAEGETQDTSPNLSLDKTTLNLTVGKTAELTATLKNPAANTKFTWTSSDDTIVKVEEKSSENGSGGEQGTEPAADDEAGGTGSAEETNPSTEITSTVTLTPLKASDPDTPVMVTVKAANGETESCNINVKDAVSKIEFTEANLTIERGGQMELTAHLSPASTFEKVEWESTDKTVATVSPRVVTTDKPNDNNEFGVITGVSPGTTSIYAKTSDSVKTNPPCTVTVSGITLSLDKNKDEIPANSSVTVNMTRYGSATVNSMSSNDWNWESDNNTVASVIPINASQGQISARAAGKATISCVNDQGNYSAEIEITVTSATASATDVSLSNNKLEFSDIVDKLKDKCQKETGNSLSYITNVSLYSTKQGTLYYGYVSPDNTGAGVASSASYYVSPIAGQRDVNKITLIPKSGYTGDILINYIGYSTNGDSFKGMITSSVKSSSAISYSSSNGNVINFQVSDFNKYSQSINGRDIASVKFSAPNSRYGFLYYDYKSGNVSASNVSNSQEFKRVGSPSLEKVFFIPDKSYSGSFTISYTGTDTANNTFRSTIDITLNASSTDSSLSYSCRPGDRVLFTTSDFTDACYDAVDKTLNYVKFDLPPSSEGTLYYDSDDEVSSSDRFYRTGSSNKLIKDVSFLSNSGFNGTVEISFTGYASGDKSFSGTVTIKVLDSASSGTIKYSCTAGKRVNFNEDDFSDLSWDITDKELRYVKFTLPSSSKGVLYYDTNTKVSSRSSYYYSGSSRKISKLSFLADDDYTGTVSISFTGYNTSSKKFTGIVEITVTAGSAVKPQSPKTVNYISNGTAVSFRAMDFTSACAASLNSQLSYVKITAPDSIVGKLYLNYDSPSQYVSFDPNQVYSVNNAPSISQISFVPAAEYNGTVYLTYTGTGTGGDTCTGNIRISISRPSSSTRFTDMWNCTWAIPSVEFMRSYGIVDGTSVNTFSPTEPTKRGDYILMLYRVFKFPDAGTNSFSDVPASSYYATAISAAKNLGIIENADRFNPASSLTREDAAIYLYNSLLYSKRSDTVYPGTSSDLAKFPDAQLVSSDAIAAMGSLASLGVFIGDEFGRLNPTLALNRAQLAVILHRALTL